MRELYTLEKIVKYSNKRFDTFICQKKKKLIYFDYLIVKKSVDSLNRCFEN